MTLGLVTGSRVGVITRASALRLSASLLRCYSQLRGWAALCETSPPGLARRFVELSPQATEP